MAQIMEADPPQRAIRRKPHPFVGEATRLHRVAVRLGHEKALTLGTNADAQEFFGLPHPPRFQFLQDGFG